MSCDYMKVLYTTNEPQIIPNTHITQSRPQCAGSRFAPATRQCHFPFVEGSNGCNVLCVMIVVRAYATQLLTQKGAGVHQPQGYEWGLIFLACRP